MAILTVRLRGTPPTTCHSRLACNIRWEHPESRVVCLKIDTCTSECSTLHLVTDHFHPSGCILTTRPRQVQNSNSQLISNVIV